MDTVVIQVRGSWGQVLAEVESIQGQFLVPVPLSSWPQVLYISAKPFRGYYPTNLERVEAYACGMFEAKLGIGPCRPHLIVYVADGTKREPISGVLVKVTRKEYYNRVWEGRTGVGGGVAFTLDYPRATYVIEVWVEGEYNPRSFHWEMTLECSVYEIGFTTYSPTPTPTNTPK